MRRASSRRGAALILVVVVIAALVAIATPFAVSMRLHEKSARGFAARVRARRLAEAARNDALAALIATHPDEERRARLARQDLQSDDEDWDSLDELRPRPRDLAGKFPLASRDSRSTIVDTEVKDERARINLNGCGPEVISNLLGVTVLSQVLSYDETDAMYVEDVRPFYSDGDPTTLDGIVWVDHEGIGYHDVDPGDPAHGRPPSLRGLVRRMYFTGGPPPENPSQKQDYHKAGVIVRDFRGLKVARDPVWRFAGTDRENECARFETPSAIRKISDWDYSSFAAAAFFVSNGVTFEKLREWGIVQEKLDLAGLDTSDIDVKKAREREDADARKRREDAERGLEALGVDPALVGRFGGDRAVVRAWELLSSLTDDDQKKKLADGYRKRGEKVLANDAKLDPFLRTEVKRQLDELIALREKTPEVEAFGRVELERIRPFITVDSAPEGELWSEPQVVNHDVLYEPFDASTTIRIQNARHVRPRAIVRLRPIGGGPAEYREVWWTVRRPDHTELHLFPQLSRNYLESQLEVSVQLPKPIDVNTAPREVLVAALTGLETALFQKASASGQTGPNVVTPTEADAVATRILQAQSPLRNLQDLRKLLDDARENNEIDQGDEEAILLNAVDPADPYLQHSTVPFCFASGDVYEITATGVVNDDASNEVARVRTREVCQVAPPRDVVWHLDSQEAFADRLATTGPLSDPNDPESFPRAFLAGRWSHLLETFPADLFQKPWTRPDRQHSQTGQVKLSMSREPATLPRGKPALAGNDGTPGVLRIEHFDQEREGHDLAQGPWILDAASFGQRSFTIEDGSVRQHLGPGSARAWFEIDKLAGDKTYLFDCGRGEWRDRLTLFYDAQASALVARVKDEALDVLETGGQPRPNVEIRAPFKPRPGNWYHVGLAWKGSDRGDLALVLDGKPVGTDSIGTRTSAPVQATDTTIQVDSTDGFPDQGFIRLGGYRDKDGLLAGDVYTLKLDPYHHGVWEPFAEILYYSSKTATSFNISSDTTWWDQRLEGRHGTPVSPGQYPPPAHLPSRGTGRWQVVNDPVDGSQMELPLGLPHDKGTPVELWGYTMWLKNGPNWGGYDSRNDAPIPPKLPSYQETVHVGGATLAQALPENTPFTLLFKNKPAGWNAVTNPRPKIVEPTDTTLPVIWAQPLASAATAGFPPEGFLRVGNERVFYRGIAPGPTGGMMFTNVERGLDGTTAIAHYLWEPVVLESLRLTNDQDYWPDPKYLGTPPNQTLLDPCTWVQLTPPLTRQQLVANQDPRVNPLVEWVRILRTDHPPHVLLPAYVPGRLGRGQTLAAGERFVLVASTRPTLYDLGVRGDVRWFPALEEMFRTGNGSIPNVNGATPVTTQPQVFKPGKNGLPPPPPLPGATHPLQWWLTHVEANGSRAQLYTHVQDVWDPRKKPNATSAGGGRPHNVGEKVIPTFCLGATHPNDLNHLTAVGKGDVVTLTDDSPTPSGEEHSVTWSTSVGGGTNAPGYGPTLANAAFGTGEIVALDDFVSKPFLGQNHARLVKYPSGQLPYDIQQMAVATARPSSPGDPVADGPGTIVGKLDELVTTQEPEPATWETFVRALHRGAQPTDWPVGSHERFPAPVTGIDASTTTFDSCIQGEVPPQQLRAGVTFKLDDELIAVQDLGPGVNGQGLQLVRGVLGTTPAAHSSEAAFWWSFPFPRLAIAQLGLSQPKGDQLPLRPGAAPFLHDRDFYVGIDRGNGKGVEELLPIRLRRGDVLLRPRDALDRGTFRGAFGSGILSDPAPNELLFDFPFRYHDRYAPRVSSLEGVFFEATKELPGAYFESITWEADLPNPYTKVIVAVRVDGAPSWDDEPASKAEPGQRGKLYLFDDPKEANKLLLHGDKVEIRAYLTYRPQAFMPGPPQEDGRGDGWKQTPTLRAIRLTYRQPTRVRRHEELPD